MTTGPVDTMLSLPAEAEPVQGEALPSARSVRALFKQLDIHAPLVVRLLAGVAAGLAGYLLSELTQAVTGESTVILSMVPVVLVAYRCGFAAGVVATAVAYFLGIAFVFPPAGLEFEDRGQATRLAISASVFLMMSVLADWFRHAQLRSEELLASSEDLRVEAAASEQRWRVLAETMPGLVAQSDGAGRMTFYNKRYEDYTGLTSAELTSDPTRILHPDDIARLEKSFGEVYRTGQAQKDEWRIRSAEGEYRWHTGYAAPEVGADGRVLSVVGGAIDIHDRKLAEAAVEAQRGLFDTIISAAPVGIGVWDLEYRCLTVNDALVKMNGIPREKTLGRTPEEYLPDHWPVFKPYFEAALRGEATVGLEMEATNASGEWSAIVASYYPVRAQDQVTGVALVCTDVTPQHMARRELARSEERYRELSEAMPAMVSLIDDRGRSYFWNRAFFEYTGLTIEQAMDWWNEGLAITDDVQAIAEEWTRQVTKGLPAQAEIRVRRRDGMYRWHHVRAVPFGYPAQWLLVATDIHDRKESEDRLREAARQSTEARAILDGIVHQAPLGIAFLDPQGRFVHINQTLAEFDGIPLAEHIGKPVGELMKRLWSNVEPIFQRITSGAEDFVEFEYMARTPSDPSREEHHWKLRWYAVRDDEGTLFGVSVLVEDITEERRAEVASKFLEEASQQLGASLDYEQNLNRVARLAVEHLADICVVDIFPDENDAVRAAAAVSNDDLAAPLSEVHLRDWRVNGSGEVFAVHILRGRELYVREITEEWLRDHAPGAPELRAAQRIQAKSLLSIPLRVKGRVIGAITLVTATSEKVITERDRILARELATRLAYAVENSRLFDEAQKALDALRESDEWLRAANAAKDEFLSLVSHELRTPITTILGNANVIQRHGALLAPEDLDSAINDIYQDASRLNGIIDNLLALARLERGQQVETEPLVLRRIVRRVVDAHAAEHPEREYRVNFPPETILVDGNAVYMEQVMRNLLSNAERYSPDGSPIDIEAGRNNGVLRISVMDRGIGIDPAEAKALFEPFFRSTRTSNTKGIGVGLSVCKRLVEFQGGSLVAEPREAGGSVFSVFLPVSEAADLEFED